MSNVHILPDENLGGVLREYVEVDRKAKVGDKKILPDGTILTAVKPYDRGDGKTPGMWFQDTHGERYPYYNNDNNRLVEPTDIVHIDGQRYRMVDREAKVGEKVIVVKAYINGESYKNGDIFIVHEVQHSVIFITVDSGRYVALSHFEYSVLDPVESAEENDDVLTVDETEVSKSVIDLLANLARRVTELERKLTETNKSQAHPQVLDMLANLSRRIVALEMQIARLEQADNYLHRDIETWAQGEHGMSQQHEDVKFLIEQVERVKELESRNKQLQKQVQELKEQNERCRKAFESRYPDLLDELKKIKELEKENRKLKAFYEYWEELYGQGLEIANWHLNGNLESFDSFFEDALEKMGSYNKQRRNK